MSDEAKQNCAFTECEAEAVVSRRSCREVVQSRTIRRWMAEYAARCREFRRESDNDSLRLCALSGFLCRSGVDLAECVASPPDAVRGCATAELRHRSELAWSAMWDSISIDHLYVPQRMIVDVFEFVEECEVTASVLNIDAPNVVAWLAQIRAAVQENPDRLAAAAPMARTRLALSVPWQETFSASLETLRVIGASDFG